MVDQVRELVIGPDTPFEPACNTAWSEFTQRIKNDKNREFAEQWFKVGKSGRYPTRSDITLESVAYVAPGLVVLRFNDEIREWKVCLCGTQIVEELGTELTNKNLAEIAGQSLVSWWKNNLQHSMKGQPCIETFSLGSFGRAHRCVESVCLPLAGGQPGSFTSHISCSHFFNTSDL